MFCTYYVCKQKSCSAGPLLRAEQLSPPGTNACALEVGLKDLCFMAQIGSVNNTSSMPCMESSFLSQQRELGANYDFYLY